MNISCFLCGKLFNLPHNLFEHLKNYSLPPDVVHMCTFSKCFQQFYDKNSYKRHVLKHFKRLEIACKEQLQNNECTINDKSPVYDNVPSSPPKVFEYQKGIKMLHESAEKFLKRLCPRFYFKSYTRIP